MKRRDRPMEGPLGPKQNKLVASKIPEKTESCRKMRKNGDRSSDSFIASPPRPLEWEIAAEKYLEATENESATIDKAPIILKNSNDSVRQNESEKQFEHVPFSFPLEEDVKPSQAIIVNGSDITSEIPEKILDSYFDICRAQSTLLHMGLPEGIPIEDAVFYISQTVSIASKIKNCNISTPSKDIVYWGKALKSYSFLGMDVGFICDRVDKLLNIKIKAIKAVDRKRDNEAKVEKEGNEEKIRCFELDIEEMIEKIKRCELEIDKIKEHNIKLDDERESIRKMAEEFEAMFKVEASAPW